MDKEARAAARRAYTALLEETLQKSADGVALLVLDEAVAACNHGLIEEARLLDFCTINRKILRSC